MAAVTPAQIRQARADGYQAGYSRAPATPNPYAPPYVPPWERPRTPDARAEQERERRPALMLARIWRAAYARGMTQYGRDTGRDWLVTLAASPDTDAAAGGR